MKLFLIRLSVVTMFVVCLSIVSNCQTYTVNYLYDDNGNRTDRVIIVIADYIKTSTDTTTVVRSSSPMQEKHKNDNDSIDISVYPNPVMEGLTIRLTSYDRYADLEASLYSVLGICVRNIAIVAEETYIDLSDLPSGNYILKLIGYDDRRIWKIVKR